MSYRCTQLANVPVREDLRYYVYVLEDPDTEHHRLTPSDFDALGRRLGNDILAVAGVTEAFCTEVIHAYVADIRARQRIETRYADFPMLLITEVPPLALSHTAPQYALIPLGPLDEEHREEAVHFLCEALCNNEFDISSLQKQIDNAVKGPWTTRLIERLRLSLGLFGLLTVDGPTIEELRRP